MSNGNRQSQSRDRSRSRSSPRHAANNSQDSPLSGQLLVDETLCSAAGRSCSASAVSASNDIDSVAMPVDELVAAFPMLLSTCSNLWRQNQGRRSEATAPMQPDEFPINVVRGVFPMLLSTCSALWHENQKLPEVRRETKKNINKWKKQQVDMAKKKLNMAQKELNKPLTAWIIFCRENMERAPDEFEGLDLQQRAKKLQDKWTATPWQEKGSYEQQARESKEEYEKCLAEYKNSDAFKEFTKTLASIEKQAKAQAQKNKAGNKTKRTAAKVEALTATLRRNGCNWKA